MEMTVEQLRKCLNKLYTHTGRRDKVVAYFQGGHKLKIMEHNEFSSKPKIYKEGFIEGDNFICNIKDIAFLRIDEKSDYEA